MLENVTLGLRALTLEIREVNPKPQEIGILLRKNQRQHRTLHVQ